MKGYWNRPEATAEAIPDGWFRTGDIGHAATTTATTTIVDRKKDLIIRGGYNVYPREVEEVLYEHPAVAEAAVDRRSSTPSSARRSARRSRSRPARPPTPRTSRTSCASGSPRTSTRGVVWLVDDLPKGADRQDPPPQGHTARRRLTSTAHVPTPERATPVTSLHDPLTLPNGQVLPNRIMKAALSEALGDKRNAPDGRLEQLYSTWAEGGYGLLITGNVMVDRAQLGEPGNVVDRGRARPATR